MEGVVIEIPEETSEEITTTEENSQESTTASSDNNSTVQTSQSQRQQEFAKQGKVAIKKSTKKNKAKKVKITLKKVLKVSDGYQIWFYKTKANAKKNKKAIAKVLYRKNSRIITAGHRKLRNKKKLFVHVRGYIVTDGVYSYESGRR